LQEDLSAEGVDFDGAARGMSRKHSAEDSSPCSSK
jgi:hypothetical protein